MNRYFEVIQRSLGLSECERLCRRPSREIEELASLSGGRCTWGERFSVRIGTALNMLILSTAANYGVERHVMPPWLPGLRDEALLTLGEDTLHWTFEGEDTDAKQFWPILYGTSDAVRPRIAGLLGCYSGAPTRELRYFSPSDVQIVSGTSSVPQDSGRTPRFIINAGDLAAQLAATCGAPLFTARAVGSL